ncbi:MAG TPA: hypothetical protein VIU11_20130 [Nakamurella sp.]
MSARYTVIAPVHGTKGTAMATIQLDNKRAIVAAVWFSALASTVALILSGIALFASPDDEDDYRRDIEARLVCLELPGPNDCGLDGL